MKQLFVFCFMLAASVALAQESFVAAGGTEYHVLLKGLDHRKPGTPVIVLESGMGVDLQNWHKVFDQLSSFAPVFAYDRAGIGKSDRVFQMPTPRLVAARLH